MRVVIHGLSDMLADGRDCLKMGDGVYKRALRMPSGSGTLQTLATRINGKCIVRRLIGVITHAHPSVR